MSFSRFKRYLKSAASAHKAASALARKIASEHADLSGVVHRTAFLPWHAE